MSLLRDRNFEKQEQNQQKKIKANEGYKDNNITVSINVGSEDQIDNSDNSKHEVIKEQEIEDKQKVVEVDGLKANLKIKITEFNDKKQQLMNRKIDIPNDIFSLPSTEIKSKSDLTTLISAIQEKIMKLDFLLQQPVQPVRPLEASITNQTPLASRQSPYGFQSPIGASFTPMKPISEPDKRVIPAATQPVGTKDVEPPKKIIEYVDVSRNLYLPLKRKFVNRNQDKTELDLLIIEMSNLKGQLRIYKTQDNTMEGQLEIQKYIDDLDFGIEILNADLQKLNIQPIPEQPAGGGGAAPTDTSTIVPIGGGGSTFVVGTKDVEPSKQIIEYVDVSRNLYLPLKKKFVNRNQDKTELDLLIIEMSNLKGQLRIYKTQDNTTEGQLEIQRYIDDLDFGIEILKAELQKLNIQPIPEKPIPEQPAGGGGAAPPGPQIVTPTGPQIVTPVGGGGAAPPVTPLDDRKQTSSDILTQLTNLTNAKVSSSNIEEIEMLRTNILQLMSYAKEQNDTQDFAKASILNDRLTARLKELKAPDIPARTAQQTANQEQIDNRINQLNKYKDLIVSTGRSPGAEVFLKKQIDDKIKILEIAKNKPDLDYQEMDFAINQRVDFDLSNGLYPPVKALRIIRKDIKLGSEDLVTLKKTDKFPQSASEIFKVYINDREIKGTDTTGTPKFERNFNVNGDLMTSADLQADSSGPDAIVPETPIPVSKTQKLKNQLYITENPATTDVARVLNTQLNNIDNNIATFSIIDRADGNIATAYAAIVMGYNDQRIIKKIRLVPADMTSFGGDSDPAFRLVIDGELIKKNGIEVWFNRFGEIYTGVDYEGGYNPVINYPYNPDWGAMKYRMGKTQIEGPGKTGVGTGGGAFFGGKAKAVKEFIETIIPHPEPGGRRTDPRGGLFERTNNNSYFG